MPPTRQLVCQRTLNSAHKRRSSASTTVWFIGKRQSGHIYYLADFDDGSLTALWSKYKKDGMFFENEGKVHEFISTHLNNRTDIMLIQTGR